MIQQKSENGSLVEDKNIREKKRRMMDQAQDFYHTAENVVTKVADRSTDLAKNYPLSSLAVAAGCGFLLARLFTRRTS